MSRHEDSEARIRRWSASEIAERAASRTSTTTRTLIPEMVKAKVIARRGRCWFGRAADIDAWLLGRWEAPGSRPTPEGRE